MLRIAHCAHVGRRIALTVEGRIAEEWVPLLEQEIAVALQAARSVEIDLARVSYIDTAGIHMLHEIRTDRLRLTHAPAFIQALLTAAPAPE
jgi:ABC-type transporter Mla MlaB component